MHITTIATRIENTEGIPKSESNVSAEAAISSPRTDLILLTQRKIEPIKSPYETNIQISPESVLERTSAPVFTGSESVR